MCRQSLFALVVFFFAIAAHADQITLKNGDRLTGSVVKSDGKTVTLKTDALGSVDISLDAVQTLSTDKPLFVQSSSAKQTYSGTVTMQGDSVLVQSQPDKTVTVARADITVIRSPDEQAAFDKLQHPGLLQGWSGGANLGFAVTGGNTETENLNVAFNAARTGLHDKLLLYTNAVYAKNNAPGATPATSADLVQGGARYDHDFTPRLFAFVGADFMTNQLQDLNLRSVFGGGIGLHLIKSPVTTLDILAGINYTHENDYVPATAITPSGTTTMSFAAGTFGEEFTHNFGKSTVVSEKGYIFPDFDDTSQYRATFNLGSVTKLNKWLGWQNSFGDIYVTNPPNGTKDNDVIFTTGLNISFTH